MNSGRDQVQAPYVSATFRCDRCGSDAATVSVRGRGVPDPSETTIHAGLIQTDRVVVEFGDLSMTLSGESVDQAIPDALAAIGAADAAALYEADREMAPFWCPTCRATYCRAHWLAWEVHDPEWAEWYEETRGRCPEGHERQLYD